MTQIDIIEKQDYGIIVRLIADGINSPKQIHDKAFKTISREEVQHKLSNITTKYYKFLCKDKIGKIAHYSINLPYWFEYMDNNHFKHFQIAKIQYRSTLGKLLIKYIKNEVTKPISINTIIHRFILYYAIEKYKLKMPNNRSHLEFMLKSITYMEKILLYTDSQIITKALNS